MKKQNGMRPFDVVILVNIHALSDKPRGYGLLKKNYLTFCVKIIFYL